MEDFAVVFNVRRPAIEKEEAGDDCLQQQQQQPPRPFEKKEATTAALLDLGLGGVIGFFLSSSCFGDLTPVVDCNGDVFVVRYGLNRSV